MADCPKVEFESHTWYSDCKYICGLTGARMDVDDARVKCMCKAEYGEHYRDCPVYQRYA